MAGFELARPGAFGGWLRDWRPGPFLPLYAAALLAGAGLGIGFSVFAADAERVAPRGIVEAPAAAAPAQPAAGIEPAQPPEPAAEDGMAFDPGRGALPMELARALGAFGPWSEAAPATEASAPQPAAPTAPVRPAAAPPAPQPAAANPPASPAAAPAAPPAKPNFYVPQVSGGPATALELQLFELINAERAKAGLAPYVLDAGLTRIARTRSQQLIDQGYFGHVDPYGYSMYVELLAYFGYTSYAWAGENLAMNNYPAGQAAAVALEGLMNSPTHRANLLAGDFSRVGIGEITDAQGRHYFTMIFLG